MFAQSLLDRAFTERRQSLYLPNLVKRSVKRLTIIDHTRPIFSINQVPVTCVIKYGREIITENFPPGDPIVY